MGPQSWSKTAKNVSRWVIGLFLPTFEGHIFLSNEYRRKAIIFLNLVKVEVFVYLI